jgi:hypothetical protein
MALKFAVNNSLSAVTSLPTAVPTGSMTLLQTQTASSSSTIDFTSNIDSTYDVYVFKFYNMHPATNDVILTFNGSTDSGSNYNVTKTTTFFVARHSESGTSNFGYVTNRDEAQSTSAQKLNYDVGNLDDEDVCGTLTLYNPSSTTFVKHFVSRAVGNGQAEECHDSYVSGYFNTTSSIDAVRFQMSSGNIDSGVIKLYGIS